jgi:hypothetical protein
LTIIFGVSLSKKYQSLSNNHWVNDDRSRPGAPQCVVQNIKVANRGDDEGVVDADAIGQRALQDRQNRAAYNGHYQHSGAVACQWAKLSNSKRKNTGEHNGIEETHGNDAPHGNVASG